MTTSNFSKQTMIHYLKIDPNKITATRPDIGRIFKLINKEYVKQHIVMRYRINTEFFIYGGTISFAKEVGNLIRVFRIAKNKGLRSSLMLTSPPADCELIGLYKNEV